MGTCASRGKDAKLLGELELSDASVQPPSFVVPLLAIFVPAIIGCGLAELIFNLGATTAYSQKIFGVVADYDLGYAFLGAVAISWLTRFLNFYPVPLKDAAFSGKAEGNDLTRMHKLNPDWLH